MRAPAFMIAGALAVLALRADTADAAPRLPPTPLDVELRQAEVGNVFLLLAEAGKRKVVLDPCVKGKVDLKLQNAPLPLVFDVLAAKLRLRYGERDGAITVSCLGPDEPAAAPDPRLDNRVSASVREASARNVITMAAQAAGLAGVDFRAAGDPRVTITVESVRLATLLAAITDAAGLRFAVEGDRLVVTGP